MKLYPPNIEGTIPAFSGDKLIVPFTMNRTVNQNSVRGFALKIKTVQSNKLLCTLKSYNFDFDLSEVIFNELPDLNIGQYYKLQLAYIDNIDGTVGYYSTVGVVKYTTIPEVRIDGLKTQQINMHSFNYVGFYSQESQDVTEKVYSYEFTVHDSNGNLFAGSGEQIHNHSEDNEIYESSDSFILDKELGENKTYYIQYSVTTSNKMKITSPRYRIMERHSIDPEIQATLVTELNKDNGYINLKLVGKKEDNLEIAATGAFIITRSSSKDNYGSWDTILKFVLHGQQPSRWLWKDFTVEHGYTYKYALQQYNDYGLYSNRILSNPIEVSFEDSFLYDGQLQLKIKYNPKVSSFKNTILESKVDTIGSKYPFIFRNGNVCYKEFPISGLISYQMDEEQLFITESDLKLSEKSTNLTDENLTAERIFKLKVLEFLTNGKPKIFRSPVEGNYIVRLMNSSLSPTDTVGRMLHTFSTTAYEIAEYTYQKLGEYNFINVADPTTEQMQWETIPLVWTDGNGKVSYAPTHTKLNKHIATTVRFLEMMPGDLVSIDGKVVSIGATGSYSIDIGTTIKEIKLVDDRTQHQGQIIYSYLSNAQNRFNTITDMTIRDIPLIQFIGENDVFKNIEDIKTSIEGFYFLHFTKRNIVELYTNNANTNRWTSPTLASGTIFSDYDPFSMYKVINVESNPTFKEYFVDGLTKKTIQPELYLNKIYINGVEMDLTETITYSMQAPTDIKSIKITNGIMAECSIQIKELVYKLETSPEVAEKKTIYNETEDRVMRFIYGIYDETLGERLGIYLPYDGVNSDFPNVNTYLNLLNQSINQRDIAYKNFILKLEEAIAKEEEENGQ